MGLCDDVLLSQAKGRFMPKPMIAFAAGALLLAALPAWAQSAPTPAPGYDTRTAQWDRDHCASNSGQRDPNCVVGDTGASTYRDSDAAGWIGTSLGEAAHSR
jgi:hypothetical protein